MRIHVHRTGGFSGVDRRAEIDTADRDDADDLRSLADKAVATARSEPPSGSRTASATGSPSTAARCTAPIPGSPTNSGR